MSPSLVVNSAERVNEAFSGEAILTLPSRFTNRKCGPGVFPRVRGKRQRRRRDATNFRPYPALPVLGLYLAGMLPLGSPVLGSIRTYVHSISEKPSVTSSVGSGLPLELPWKL